MSQSPRDRIAQRRQLQKQQSQIFLELLPVLDDLDRACNHWQQAQQQCQQASGDSASGNWWQRLFRRNAGSNAGAPSELKATVTSAYDGVALIRQSLLEILERQSVIPIETLGHSFDPRQMNAMGRDSSPDAAPNTVIKEILKGYCWQDKVLREAQVIVADAADTVAETSLKTSD